MGGKNNTSTKSENTSQTYTPAGAAQLQEIWKRVQEAASTPYTPYGGEMVAGLNPVQQGGINNIIGATSYLDTAGDYARRGAAPIEADALDRYYNPFQSKVIDATRANFGEDNAIQRNALKGDAISMGALGGNRVGVAQAELARKQKLAQDPVIAGLESQGFNLALAAAQQDRAAQAQGGYQFGALGNSAIGQGQAQIGAGSLGQGVDQARLTAAYQQYLQEQAFPYQQAQFLASAGLPAVAGMGGSQTGQSNSTSTTPGPSPLGQILGAGLTAAGMFIPGMQPLAMAGAGLGAMGGSSFGGSSMGPNVGMSGLYRRGGRVGRSHGGRVGGGDFVQTVHSIRQALRGGGPVIDTRRDPNGIYVPSGFADGGGIPSFEDRWGPFPAHDNSEDITMPGVMLQDVSPMAMNAWRQGVDASLADAPPLVPTGGEGQPGGLPSFMRPAPGPDMPGSALAFNGGAGPGRMPLGGPGVAPVSLMPDQGAGAPLAMPSLQGGAGAPQGPSGGGLFNLSDDARAGLITAGLGMMASQSPFALSQIGEGGLKGMQAFTEAKKSRQSNEVQARKLIQDAEQFAKGLDVRERTLKETERYHNMMSGDRDEARAERERAARERSEDRRDAAARTAYPGEGLDENGNTVRGLYQFNPETREYDFKPGKVIQKGAGAGAKEGQTERLIKSLREENPTLSQAEALAMTKRAPNGDMATLRRESLALSAAKADLGYLRDPSGTLDKWRKQYGLGATAPAAEPAKPAGPATKLQPIPPDVLEKARAAIKAGKPRGAIEQRLRDHGLDPSGL